MFVQCGKLFRYAIYIDGGRLGIPRKGGAADNLPGDIVNVMGGEISRIRMIKEKSGGGGEGGKISTLGGGIFFTPKTISFTV